MPSYTLEVLTEWVGDGASIDTSYRPKVVDDYPSLLKCENVGDQPAEEITPAPNMLVVKLELTETDKNAITADPAYKGQILSVEQ